MIQVVKQTDKQKKAMYMKCSKKDLAKMLINCNKHLDTKLQVGAPPETVPSVICVAHKPAEAFILTALNGETTAKRVGKKPSDICPHCNEPWNKH